MSKNMVQRDEVLEVCAIPKGMLNLITESGFESQSSFNPRRGLRVSNFINAYMSPSHFEGKRILELGPGHYSFALIARYLGAEVVCIERNQGFIDLGRALNLDVRDLDFIRDLDELRALGRFDGLWAKGVYNAYLYDNDEMSAFQDTLSGLVNEGSWGFFVTVNKGEDQEKLARAIAFQHQSFIGSGWRDCGWSEDFARQYAMRYAGSSQYVRGFEIG